MPAKGGQSRQTCLVDGLEAAADALLELGVVGVVLQPCLVGLQRLVVLLHEELQVALPAAAAAQASRSAAGMSEDIPEQGAVAASRALHVGPDRASCLPEHGPAQQYQKGMQYNHKYHPQPCLTPHIVAHVGDNGPICTSQEEPIASAGINHRPPLTCTPW